MKLQYVNPGYEYMVRQILEFQREETSFFWAEPLFYFYPELDREYMQSLSMEEKKKYFEDVFGKIYQEKLPMIEEKIAAYSRHWEVCRPQIEEALSEAFEVDCSQIFNDLRCNISLNPIEPRYLQEHSFDVFYLNSERGAVGSAIHEIIHFVWFYVWHNLFGDGYEEYETPSLKWILSEMVVESVMRDPRLSSINPYFERSEGGCIYAYFFDMKAEGEYVLEVLDKMYREQPIHAFMKNSYTYCKKHEDEIRAHIQMAEQHI